MSEESASGAVEASQVPSLETNYASFIFCGSQPNDDPRADWARVYPQDEIPAG